MYLVQHSTPTIKNVLNSTERIVCASQAYVPRPCGIDQDDHTGADASTNRFDISAEEIGDIYRSRWAIELFFKWLKHHVRIKRFYGMSETDVQNQIYIALITYCLLVLVQLETSAKQSLLRLRRWLQAMLWKPYDKWFGRIHFRREQQARGKP